MKKSKVWIAFLAVSASLWLVGCNNAPAAEDTSKSDVKAESADASQKPASDAPGTTEASKDPAAEKADASAKTEPDKSVEATADPTKAPEKPKDDSAEKAEAQKEANAAAAKADAEQGIKNLGDARKMDGKPSNVRAEPAGKPTPTVPPNANRSATQQNFVGTWKREIEADLRKKYEAAIAAQKKRGKKTYPIDNIMVLKADGTFTWDDNAGIIGRKVEGTWSVQNGEARFKIVKVDGKAPDSKDTKEFKAMVSRDGSELFRNNSERNKFRKS